MTAPLRAGRRGPGRHDRPAGAGRPDSGVRDRGEPDAVDVLVRARARVLPYRWGWVERRHSALGTTFVDLMVHSPDTGRAGRAGVRLWHHRMLITVAAVVVATAVTGLFCPDGILLGPLLGMAVAAGVHLAARPARSRCRRIRVIVWRPGRGVSMSGEITAFVAVFDLLRLVYPRDEDGSWLPERERRLAHLRGWKMCHSL